MKKLNNISQTLMAKLIAMLIIMSLVPVLVTGFSSYGISKKVLNKKLELTSSQTTKEITRGIDNYFNAMSNIIKILANDINIQEANNPTYFEFAKGLISNMKSSDNTILDIYVGTEEGMFYAELSMELPSDFNHREREWYLKAIENKGDITIIDPYIDADTGKMVITMSSAIYKGDEIIGVVGMDIDLTTYSNSLSDIKIGEEGNLIIVDSKGLILAHPNQSIIGTKISDQISVWDEIKNENNGFTDYEFEDSYKFAVFETSEVTGWKSLAAMDYEELSNDTRDINRVIQMVSIITVVGAILIAFLFSKPISKNVRTLLAAFKKLSEGDLKTTISINSRDEFKVLGKNFNEMAGNILRLIRNVGDASITVLDTSTTLANMAEETNASLNEVARAVEDVAKGATEQAQNASEGASSVSDLGVRLNLINESTNMIEDLSCNANDLTLRGLDSMEDLILKSDQTMKSTSEVTELVYETSESMKQINVISTTIETITAQTNLLSLNAAIEAARAGESGRGFAVVADEIRNLSEQSKTATIKIKEIVEDIIKKTEQSVEAMKVTNINVNEQVVLVNDSKSIFNEIINAVQVLSEKVTEIKQNTDEITNQKNNIVSQIESISAISEESASATEEVTASTEQITVTMDSITIQASELQKLSEQLQDKINTFKY
ncbi:MAG: chemotaxis protein [Clostridiales bacterium]|jgi:methyl-accepting chemotaxis protein|nr:chemotaxis protein [Clostridiales bacterium]